jgi:hypothetical protein
MAGEFGLGMQGIGAIMSMIGAYSSSQGQKSSLGFQADLAAINATTAERAAQAAMLQGQHEEQHQMLATAQLKSTQQVGFAANGIDLGEGSAARVLTSTDVMGEIDKNTIAANAVRRAWGYRTQAVNFQNDALMKNSAASAISPLMSAGTSMLNSAGSVAQNWYALNKSGAMPFTGTPSSPSMGGTPQAGP